MLAPPPRGLPPSRRILDPPLYELFGYVFQCENIYYFDRKGSFVIFSGNFVIMAVMLQKQNRQTNYGVYVMALAVLDQTVLFSTLHHFIQGRLNAWTLPPCRYIIFMGGLYDVLYFPMNVIRHQRVG